MERRPVRNTSDDGLDVLMDAMLGGGNSPDAILRQEARGQRDLVQSDVLPTQCNPHDRAALEEAGVVFGGQVPGDPLFTYVTFPPGWSKVGSDHAMWSYLLDEQGRERAAIGYKAAFYDRWASLSASRRFRGGVDYSDAAQERGETHREWAAIVTDGAQERGGRVIWRAVFADSDDSKPYAADSAYVRAKAAAAAWMAEHYPDHNDPSAYWDLPPVPAIDTAQAEVKP